MNGIDSLNNVGLDSYTDNIELRCQKLAVVKAALDIAEEENDSKEAQNAVKQHLVRYQEAIANGIDSDCIRPTWTYSTSRIKAYLGLIPSWQIPRY